ncbi:tripartite tricarboxylate transporter TctB family protein [Primorskyibacter marinus]|uniref:tripartite tricarboxylate transporter TctB family protein n=1 Tax=Primorskyibacter marinus TaxID=1977320 RepID=UPI000E300814|nr:tripartite tricarboxylate transporter TctB family protein [Primorskyibacter marinus]
MRIGDRIFGPLLAVFGAGVIWESTQLPSIPGVRFGADLLPIAIGAVLVVLGGMVLWSGLREQAAVPAEGGSYKGRSGLAALWSLGGLLLGLMLFEPLGFPLFGIGFMAVMMALMGARLRTIVLVAPAFVLALHYLFTAGLRVSLPAGLLAGVLP